MGGGDRVEAGTEAARTSLGRGWGASRAEGLGWRQACHLVGQARGWDLRVVQAFVNIQVGSRWGQWARVLRGRSHVSRHNVVPACFSVSPSP